MATLEKLFADKSGATDWQKRQWQAFVSRGFPTKKLEEWKYTTLSQNEWPLGPSQTLTPIMDLGALARLPQVLWQNGKLQISPEAAQNFSQLEKATVYNELTNFPASSLVNLNAAFSADGISLRITKRDSGKTLVLVHSAGEEVQNHPRHQITVEENCELTLIEVFRGQSRYWQNAVTTLELLRGTKVNYAKLQDEGAKAQHTGCTLASLAEDASLRGFLFSSGAALQREELLVRLEGKNSEAHLFGLCLAHEKQHHDVRTVIEHLQPHSQSSQLFKGILNDEARSVFNGRIYIAPDAQQVNSRQLNKNLLLSSRAEVDTKPELEIYADDVKATHGASVGPLNELELFYLQSRGIPKDKAIELLVQGYVEDVIQKFPLKEVQRYVMDRIAARIQETQSRLKG